MPKPKYKTIKSADEKRWAVDSAVSTLKEYAKIRKDPELMAAAKQALKVEIAESQKMVKTI